MAAWTADRKTLTLGVVNPTLQPVEIPLTVNGATLAGSGTRWQIAGPDPLAYNDPADPDRAEDRGSGGADFGQGHRCPVQRDAVCVSSEVRISVGERGGVSPTVHGDWPASGSHRTG